jgi:putative transposase
MLHAIWMAETRAAAHAAFDRFTGNFEAKYSKAIECLAKDRRSLLAFYDIPAEHWVHTRTTNAIGPAFASVRHRTDQTKGCASCAMLIALVYKLGMSAQMNWRRLRMHPEKSIQQVAA